MRAASIAKQALAAGIKAKVRGSGLCGLCVCRGRDRLGWQSPVCCPAAGRAGGACAGAQARSILPLTPGRVLLLPLPAGALCHLPRLRADPRHHRARRPDRDL